MMQDSKLQLEKLRREIEKDEKWIVILSIAMLVTMFMLAAYICRDFDDTEQLIRKNMESRGIVVTDLSIVENNSFWGKRYILINPPTDPKTGVVLENWEIYTSTPMGLMRGAICADK